MQTSVLAEAAADGIRLVISVDTGIRAFAEAAEAQRPRAGPHRHRPPSPRRPEGPPRRLAVINPAQPNCPYPYKYLCGAAVAYKLAQALLEAAAPFTPDPEAFRTRTRTVLIPSFLKLVAIATIADSVPLNRRKPGNRGPGLAALANPFQPGLRALDAGRQNPLGPRTYSNGSGFPHGPPHQRRRPHGYCRRRGRALPHPRPRPRPAELAEKLDTALNRDRRDSEAHALEAIDEELLTRIDATGAYPADV